MFDWRRGLRLGALCVALALLSGACDKPDASLTTSPSARTLLGTTTGTAAFGLEEAPPPPMAALSAWRLDMSLARFGKLENGVPALEVMFQAITQPGAALEVWLESAGGTVARWSGGRTVQYNGVVCFQLPLEGGGASVPLAQGEYHVTVAFRSPDGLVTAAAAQRVTHNVPGLSGPLPRDGSSPVFRDLLGCPRGT
jgi:hypothetical protein